MDINEIIAQIKTTEKTDFDRMELLKTYPEPVSRYLRFHLPKGIPDAAFGTVRLKGIIKLVQFQIHTVCQPFQRVCVAGQGEHGHPSHKRV